MKKIVLILFLTVLFFSDSAHAFWFFKTKSNKENKTEIVFSEFNYRNDNEESSGQDKDKTLHVMTRFLDIIKNDLSTTALFEIENDFAIKENEKTTDFDFAKYKKGKEAILRGDVKFNKNSEIELAIELYDLSNQKLALNKTYVITDANLKNCAHNVAEEIYQSLTGERVGHFNSKILYVATKNKQNKIARINFDGENLQYLTDGKNLVLTPIFSHQNKDEIFYVEYVKEMPKIRRVNVEEETTISLGEFEEMSFAPNSHPKGENAVLLSAFKNGISNIYKYNLDTDELTKLTFDKSIDVTPFFSPDGERIVFCSDRSGAQKLYIMNKDGKDVRKITHGRGKYFKPAWSPDGKSIAFVKFDKNTFHIGTINPNGENEQILVSGYLTEGVKWSPNGRYLIYTKQEKASSTPYIYITDILNKYEYRLPTPLGEEATDPDWINN